MEQHRWKLGDSCHIADVHIAPGQRRFRVMPARIVHVAGVIRETATARSVNPRVETVGKWEPFTEGQPFVDESWASAYVRSQMRKNRIPILTPILEGEAPAMKDLPSDIVPLGQVVYGLDTAMREIFEAQISYLRYIYGRVEVAYDPSPGNPKASNILIRKWWPTRAAAETYVHQTYGKRWTFISKEQLAARTDEYLFGRAEAYQES